MTPELVREAAVEGEVLEGRIAPVKSRARSYIPTLDGWRSIAVALVMGAHCTTALLSNGSRPASLLASFFNHAGYGVDIFFGISGFLICTLLLREKKRTGTISLGRFYLRRVFRILPPMLLYVACISVLAYIGLVHVERREILAVLFFYRNYIFAGWYTIHFWSLAVEEHFYAVVPLLLLFSNRKWAIRGSAFLIVLCIGIRWFEFSTASTFTSSLLQWRTENRFDGLLWGVLLAFAIDREASREWLRKYLNGWTMLLTLPLAVGLLTFFASQPSRRTIVAAVVPLFIAYTVLHADSLAGRFLELAPLKWMGRLSYSLYIWQILFLNNDARDLPHIQSFPMALVYPFICASLSYYLLEKPMMRVGHRLAASPGAPSDGRA